MIYKKKKKGQFLYHLERDYARKIPELKGINFNKKYLQIVDGVLYIPKRYMWNGNSPKFFIWDIVVGTPDGIDDKALEASLVHDALYQYLKDIGIKRSLADKIYLRLLNDFKPRYIYYSLLRCFGWYNFI